MNDRGHWELVSPLPDCPAGTKAERWLAADAFGPERWIFDSGLGNPHVCTLPEMQRNPAIFRWVPEPERVEWPSPKECQAQEADRDNPCGVPCAYVNCNSEKQALITRDAIRAVLQALREGKVICSLTVERRDGGDKYKEWTTLIEPDGSRP